MRCRTCGFMTNQLNGRHSWIYRQCAKCHYLGQRVPYYRGHKKTV